MQCPQQVGAFAQSDQTGNDLASILAAAAGRDKFDDLRTAQQALDDKTTAKSKLVDALTALEAKLKADTTGNAAAQVTNARDLIRQAEQAALIAGGSTESLPTSADAATTAAKAELKTLQSAPKMK